MGGTSQIETQTNCLVQAVEVWRPAKSEGGFELRCAAYATADAPANRIGERVGPGEGIVGEAVEACGPVIRENGDFAAGEYGAFSASHVVAIPVMRNKECRGVVTLALDEAEDRQGAFEVWRPNERNELALQECWHANLERFGSISQYVKFPRRAGLPGKVWNDRFPRVMGDLGRSPDFVRVAGAKADGLSMALGLPFMKSARELNCVMLLLSSNRTPLARAMEVWARDQHTKQLKVISADYGPYVDLAPENRRRRLGPSDGLAGRVFQQAAPVVTTDLLGVEFPVGNKLCEYGFKWGVGIPVFVGHELRAAVTLLA